MAAFKDAVASSLDRSSLVRATSAACAALSREASTSARALRRPAVRAALAWSTAEATACTDTATKLSLDARMPSASSRARRSISSAAALSEKSRCISIAPYVAAVEAAST